MTGKVLVDELRDRKLKLRLPCEEVAVDTGRGLAHYLLHVLLPLLARLDPRLWSRCGAIRRSCVPRSP